MCMLSEALTCVLQDDQHIAKLTVQETLDFSARCQGTGLYQGGPLMTPAPS